MLPNSKIWRRLILLIFGLALVHAAYFAAVYLPQALHGYSDFTIFYTAGTIIDSGHPDRLYNPETQWQVQQKCCSVPTRHAALLFNHAPFQALIFAPLARLPYNIAFTSWVFVNLGILMLIGFFLRDELRTVVPRWWMLPIAALAWVPALITLAQGQDSLLLVFFYALAFISFKRGSPFLAGVCIALAASKPQLVLPFVLILALRRQWKAVLGFFTCSAALVGLSFAAIGRTAVLGYAQFLLNFSRLPVSVSAAEPLKMPNLRGLVFKLLDVAAGPPLVPAIVIIVLSAMVLWLAARLKCSVEEEFSIAVAATLLVSYHLYVHDVTLLLVPVVLMLGRLRHERPVLIFFAVGTLPWLLLAVFYALTARDLFCLYAVSLLAFGAAIWTNASSGQPQANQVPATAST